MFRLFLGVVLGFILATMPALATGPVGTSVKDKSIKPAVQQIDLKIRDQMVKIQSASKSGKITPAQAKTLRNELQSIRKKQAGFFKQNGKRVLTTDQQGQLNQMLLNNGKSMPDDPLDIKGNSRPPDPLESQASHLK